MSTALRLEAVEYLGGNTIRASFSNGRCGVADLEPLLQGPLLAPLRAPHDFRGFELNQELGTIAWPNGADLAPEAIYFRAFEHDPTLRNTFQHWGYLDAAGSTDDRQR